MLFVNKGLNCFLLFCFAFLISLTASAQTTKVDELLTLLKKNNSDTVQIDIMRRLSAAYSAVDPIKKFYYANQYRLLAEKNGLDSVVANAYLDMGISYGMRGGIDSALHFFNLGFKKSKESNYTIGIARSYANIGFAYDRLDRKKDAVKSYEESLKIYRKANHKKGISQNIVNLGSIYYDLGEYKTANNYFQEYFEYVKETPNNEMSLGGAYFALGNSNLKLGNLNSSMDYYNKSLAIRTKIGDLNGIALSNWGIGQVYLKKKLYVAALKYSQIALTKNLLLKNPFQDCVMLITTAHAYLGLLENEKAEFAANSAISKAKEANSKGLVSLALKLLVEVKAAQNKFAEATQIQANYIAIKDSVERSDNKKGVIINDLNRVNSDNKQLLKNNKSIIAKNEGYSVVIYTISVVLIIVVLSLVLYYIRNLEKKASNNLLQKQKRKIAEVNEKLSALNQELTSQMEIASIQNIELEKLNSVKNKFFSIVSHDLRAPINNLKMLFELYHKGILDEQELNGLLIKLEDNIYTTASFLDNLLDWAKSQLEGIIVKPTDTFLKKIVEENIKLVDTQIKFKGIIIDNKIENTITAFVDSNVINIVVRNLLSNAIKFCSKGDQIIFEAKIDGGQVLFLIRDTGPGISDEQQKNLFNLAYNNSIGSSSEKGYQLGLVLCKDMINQSGGTIEVESTLGKGTVFQILMPAKA